VVDEAEIVLHLLPRRKKFRPVPFFPEFVNRVLIDLAMGIGTRTGITVPVPDATQTRACFEQMYLESKFPQTIELIDTRKACADY
jgi:hypothetical protein